MSVVRQCIVLLGNKICNAEPNLHYTGCDMICDSEPHLPTWNTITVACKIGVACICVCQRESEHELSRPYSADAPRRCTPSTLSSHYIIANESNIVLLIDHFKHCHSPTDLRSSMYQIDSLTRYDKIQVRYCFHILVKG